MLTWGAQNIKDEAGQHERQHRSVVTEVSVSELLAALSDGRHLHQAQRDLLQQRHHLGLLVGQLHLDKEHTRSVRVLHVNDIQHLRHTWTSYRQKEAICKTRPSGSLLHLEFLSNDQVIIKAQLLWQNCLCCVN